MVPLITLGCLAQRVLHSGPAASFWVGGRRHPQRRCSFAASVPPVAAGPPTLQKLVGLALEIAEVLLGLHVVEHRAARCQGRRYLRFLESRCPGAQPFRVRARVRARARRLTPTRQIDATYTLPHLSHGRCHGRWRPRSHADRHHVHTSTLLCPDGCPRDLKSLSRVNLGRRA